MNARPLRQLTGFGIFLAAPLDTWRGGVQVLLVWPSSLLTPFTIPLPGMSEREEVEERHCCRSLAFGPKIM